MEVGNFKNYEILHEKMTKDLRILLEKRDKVFEEIAKFEDLRTIVLHFQNNSMKELKTLTDIGLNILCEAKVPDLSTLMVDVGFGTCVEMTHTEILSYIPKKISILTASVADLESKIVAQQTNIRIVTAGMAEMKRELKCG